ncbi:oxaloacetate decarboxylase beta chain [Salmonella enterica subsp. enterica serovar Infantis str. 119944]|nr:oxaloacetate decarboxylase beta chain [Salmonella enterica subsp. enterica serovar Infantis str. 119944]
MSDTVQNGLINIVTIFLGLSVGAKLVADKFLQPQTLGILLLGVVAFGIGTAAGVLMAKLLNLCSKNNCAVRTKSTRLSVRRGCRRCRWRPAYRTKWGWNQTRRTSC